MNSQNMGDRNIDIDYNGYFVKSDTKFRAADPDVSGNPFAAFTFLTQWKAKSGEDANGILHKIDTTTPGLVNMTTGDFHLTAGSVARNKGLAAQCAAHDYDGVTRTSTSCDL